MKRFIPKKGKRFKAMIIRPALDDKTFVSEGEVVTNRLRAHLLGDKDIILMFDLHQFRFKPCE